MNTLGKYDNFFTESSVMLEEWLSGVDPAVTAASSKTSEEIIREWQLLDKVVAGAPLPSEAVAALHAGHYSYVYEQAFEAPKNPTRRKLESASRTADVVAHKAWEHMYGSYLPVPQLHGDSALSNFGTIPEAPAASVAERTAGPGFLRTKLARAAAKMTLVKASIAEKLHVSESTLVRTGALALSFAGVALAVGVEYASARSVNQTGMHNLFYNFFAGKFGPRQ